jgi:hypothetical protein
MTKGSLIITAALGAVSLLAAAVGGCAGAVGGNSTGPGSAGSTGSPSGAAGAGAQTTGGGGATGVGTGVGGSGATGAPCSTTASLAPARIWRITDQQYVNVVAQVFGVKVAPEVTQADTQPADFTNYSEAPELTVQANTVTAYQSVAHAAAQTAVAVNLGVFLPCGKTAPTDACVQQFIRNRVARAFGRALADAEVQDLLGIYHVGAAESPAAGIRLVIEATLQSPSFLYRTELGPGLAGGPTAKTKLTAYELAGAVAFALLDSVPDDALWARAQDGTLTTPTVLAQEVDRLLATPAVQANLSAKAGFWLGVEKLHSIVPKNTTLFPEFTAQVKDDLYASARLFVRDLFANGNVSDLLSSRRLYLNASLAKVYGIAGVTGTELMPVDGPADSRGAGILTQPAVLAAWSHPDRGDVVHRGLFIYNALVCGQPIPAPPPNATAVAAGFPKDATERELSVLRATNAAGCGACHGSFDPLGLATEQYDPIGRYQTVDAKGQPIDSSAMLRDLGGGLSGPITGLPDLVSKLKAGRRVADCASRNMAPFVLGRSVVSDNSCVLQDVKDHFASTGSFTDFYRAMLTSPGFLTRDAQ